MGFPPLPSSDDVEIEEQRTVWAGGFAAVDVVRFRHRRFDGAMSAARTWEMFRRGNAAAVLPYDPWTDQVVVIEQFRLPALAAGVAPVMVEIPAGLFGAGESAEETVRRELQEEVGLTADRLARVADVVLTPGACDERCVVFAGRVRVPAHGAHGVAGVSGLAAEHEDIRIRVEPALRASGRWRGRMRIRLPRSRCCGWLRGGRVCGRSGWDECRGIEDGAALL